MQFSSICKMKDYIQPFERHLALAELVALTGAQPQPRPPANGEPVEYRVVSKVRPEELASKLAYWECVQGDEDRLTSQTLAEATVNIVRNGIPLDQLAAQLPFQGSPPIPSRRCLRYGTHGIHEYRGKFFPQLVRSLINIANVPKGGIVADPMCGSGTTVVEAVRANCHGIGLDMNPLSVFLTRVKCELLGIDAEKLSDGYQRLREELLRVKPKQTLSKSSYFQTLPAADQTYLAKWFSLPVLCDLDAIMMAIGRLEDPYVKDLATLSVSNILRKVSWQKEDDLRVRKVLKQDTDLDPLQEYLQELGRSVRLVLAFLYQNRAKPRGTFDVAQGDARAIANSWSRWLGRVDAVIMSPPYATALPYLDTDRLSLCYLGFLSRPEHRRRDLAMIGDREVTDKVRRHYWEVFQEHKAVLPDSIRSLVERVEKLNSRQQVGFRRRNTAALLSKYFFDMKDVLMGIPSLLAVGRFAYVVVGNNRTQAGGELVDINTAELLTDLAVAVGLKHQESLPMEMLVSRDIFRKNAMPSEVILSFQRTVGSNADFACFPSGVRDQTRNGLAERVVSPR
jgi:hypothetical protein